MNQEKEKHSGMKKGMYSKFIITLVLSYIAMYVTMYMNTYDWDHVWFSLTRFYMAILGICAMAVIMLSMMLGMYKNRKKNIAIYTGSILIFFSALGLVRAQIPVDDVLWMKAMIPHHSIAILASKRANITDPEAQKLAKEIIEAQQREIAEMKKIIYRLENED